MQRLISSCRSAFMIGFILTLCTTSITISAAEDHTAAQTTILEEQNIKALDTLFGKFHEICNEMAFLIKSSQIKATKEERGEYMRALVEDRSLGQFIQRTCMMQPTAETFTHLFGILCDLIDHLEATIKNNFVGFKPFVPKDTRTQPEVYSSQEIEKLIQEKIELVTKIQKESEDASLSPRNRFYRNNINPLFQFCDKYKLHWWAGGLTLATLGAAYLTYRFNQQTYGLPFELGGDIVYSGGDIVPKSMYTENDPLYKRAFGWMWEHWLYGVRKVCKWPLRNPESALYNTMVEKALENTPAIEKPFAQVFFDRLQNVKADLLRRPTGVLAEIEEFGHTHAVGGACAFGALIGAGYKFGITELASSLKNKIERWILKIHSRCMGGAFHERFKNEAYEFQIEPRYTFDDIIGQEYAKQKLQDVIKYIEDPEKYLRSGLKPPVTIILYGDSRTGKTMIVEGLAGELRKKKTREEFPFYQFSAHHITRNVFEFLMHNVQGPCIVFIDEFDLLQTNRENKNGGSASQLAEILNTLSGCMNNTTPDKPIIFIAACNTPGEMDRPLIQRFAQQIPFEKPSFENRMIYFTDQLMKKGLSFHPMEIQTLCSLTDNCTYENISKVIEITCFRKSRTGIPVSMQDIIDTINTDIHHVIMHDFKDLSDAEKNILATHMVGHMFATLWMQNPHEQLAQITIRPVKNPITKGQAMDEPVIHYGEIVTSNFGDTLSFEDRAYYKAKCMQKLAGLITEEVLLGKQHITKYSCSCKDKAEALAWAKKYCLNGLNEKEIQESKHLKEKLAADAHAFIEDCQAELREKIADKAELFAFMVEQLLQLESLDAGSLEILTRAHPKVQAGKPFNQALQEAMAEMQADFEEQMAAMQKAGAPSDETALFNH